MAKRITGVTVEIGGDTTALSTAIKNLNKEINESQSELKEVEKLLKMDPTSTELLTQKQRYLGEEIEATRKKLETLKSLEGQMTDQLNSGKISQDKYDAFQREIMETEDKLKSLEKQATSLPATLQSIGGTLDGVGDKLTNVGNKLLPITAGITALGGSAVKTANEFESSMSQTAGALDIPVDQMENLRELALQMGQDTIFSAKEAGEAMTELAKGGLTEAQIEGGALASTMDLAASSGMELGNAANTVVQTMGAFQLGAEDSAVAVNALAGAAAASSTDVEPLTQALSQVAAQAYNAGWNVQDTTAVLAAFADAGINGSDAGTSLKTMLQRLAAPTDKAAALIEDLGINTRDSNGYMLSASDLAQELQDKLGTLEPATRDAAMQTIFGSDAMRAATVMMSGGSEAIEKYTAATYDMEAASRLANSQMGEGELAMEQLKGSIETALITIGTQLAPVVTDIVNGFTDLVNKFGELDEETQKTIITFAGIAAAAGPVLSVLGKLSSALSLLFAHPVIAGITAVAAVIGVLAAAIGSAKDETNALVEASEASLDAQTEQLQAARNLRKEYDDLAQSRRESNSEIMTEYGYYNTLADELEDIVDENGRIKEGYEERAEVITGQLADALGIEIEIVDGVINKYGELTESIDQIIAKKQAEALLNQNEQAWLDAKSKQLELYTQLTDAQDRYNQAYQQYNDTLRQIAEKEAEMKELQAGLYTSPGQVLELAEEIDVLKESALNYKNEWLMASAEVQESNAVFQQNEAVIQNYGNLLTAVASGDIEEMNNAVVRMTENFQTAETANEATLQKQLDTLTQTYEMMRQGVEEGSLQISQEQMEAYEGLIADAQNELQKFKMQHVTEMKESGLEGAVALGYTRQAYIDETGQTVESVNTEYSKLQLPGITERKMDESAQAMRNMADTIDKAARYVRNTAEDELENSNTSSIGYDFTSGFASGIRSGQGIVGSAASALASIAMNNLKNRLAISSPSKVTKEYGEFTTEGFAIGMTDELGQVAKAANEVTDTALAKLRTSEESYRRSAQVLTQSANVRSTPVQVLQNIYLGGELIANKVTDAVISNIGGQQSLDSLYKGWVNA